MTEEWAKINEAIPVYLSFDTAPYPRINRNGIVAMFGLGEASVICAKIEDLMMELRLLISDMMTSDIAVEDAAGKVLADRHPHLSEKSLAALVWEATWERR